MSPSSFAFDGTPGLLRPRGSARAVLLLCSLMLHGTKVAAKATNMTSTLCQSPTGGSYIQCGPNQPLQILAATTYSVCGNDSSTCGSAIDASVTAYLNQQCFTGASSCLVNFGQIQTYSDSCFIQSFKVNFTCDAALPSKDTMVGTTVPPDKWWESYSSWQFIVIWCVVGCVIIIVIITVLLLLCGCCPKCCHRYDEPNVISKMALMTLSSIDRTTMVEYNANSSFSLSREANGEANGQQSDYCSVSSSGGRRTPEGGSSMAVAPKLGGQLSGSQATLDRGSALGARQGSAGGGSTLEYGPTRGGRVTASQGASDKMSTLSRQSESGGAGGKSPSSLSGVAGQSSSQDSGIGGGFDEPDLSGIEFGTKKRSKQDPQTAYFGQKGLACPADVAAPTSTLKRPGNGSSAGDSGRPRGLFQKNTAGAGGKDGLRNDLSSPSDPKAFDPAGAGGVYATATRRGSSFSALTDPDPAAMAAQRSATLSRLHSRSKSAMALLGADDALHALRMSTLTREKTKTQESNRTVTMSLEQALAAGHINAAASPAWSDVVTTATLPRPRLASSAGGKQGSDCGSAEAVAPAAS